MPGGEIMKKRKFYATRTETRVVTVYVEASNKEEAEELLSQDYDSHHEIKTKLDTWDYDLEGDNE